MRHFGPDRATSPPAYFGVHMGAAEAIGLGNMTSECRLFWRLGEQGRRLLSRASGKICKLNQPTMSGMLVATDE